MCLHGRTRQCGEVRPWLDSAPRRGPFLLTAQAVRRRPTLCSAPTTLPPRRAAWACSWRQPAGPGCNTPSAPTFRSGWAWRMRPTCPLPPSPAPPPPTGWPAPPAEGTSACSAPSEGVRAGGGGQGGGWFRRHGWFGVGCGPPRASRPKTAARSFRPACALPRQAACAQQPDRPAPEGSDYEQGLFRID